VRGQGTLRPCAGLASVHDRPDPDARAPRPVAVPGGPHLAAVAGPAAAAEPHRPDRASAHGAAAGLTGRAVFGRPYRDRRDAGRRLAACLTDPARATAVPLGPGVLVLGLPRGGVLVAAEIAAALGAELDVVAVRKLGLPGRPELAMGALAAVGEAVESVRSEVVLARVVVDPGAAEEVRRAELAELRRRQSAYRGDRPPPVLAGRTVVLADDGLATGSTMRAALAAVRSAGPAAVVVAVPVGTPDVCAALDADEVVCPLTPEPFGAVGRHYDDFGETTDDEVRAALAGAAGPDPA
jgi:putative phosphoribosyl transferase